MLSRENFTRDHVFEIKESSGADPAIIERAIYAFGLLEAIKRTGLPFVFKGGICEGSRIPEDSDRDS